jgi:hypothetical protein
MNSKTTHEMATSLIEVISNNYLDLPASDLKIMVRGMLAEHIYDFIKLEKNIQDTSLPHEKMDRLNALYLRFSIHTRPIINK